MKISEYIRSLLMKTRKVAFLLFIALLVSGLLLTSCPGETTKEVIPEEGSDLPRQVQVIVQPSALRFDSVNAASGKTTLTVKVSNAENVPSYQWHSRTSRAGDWNLLNGEIKASFTPQITAAGEYFYFVAVKVDGKELTGYAQITIGSPGTAETQFTIGDDRVHYVRGVGGTGSFMFKDGDNADASPDADVKYIDLLMGEMGCNILRIMVQDNYKEYIQNKVQSRNKNVFIHDANKNFFAVIRRANELGGYVFANPWTAPAEYKTNKSTKGGFLTDSASNYVAYANYLRGFLKWLNENNAPIFALGILNEPDYGNQVAYEGMGMSSAAHKNWFKTVGHFTTQRSEADEDTAYGEAKLTNDIIPGYGGGKKTHHVMVMTGDIMGQPVTYHNETIDDPVANNNFEILGRHWYAGGAARITKLAGPADTRWDNRPQTNYEGSFERESLAQSPQMYAPGSTAGNIIREIWQTEHDFNYWSNSTNIPKENPQRFWNSAFAAMNDVDWALRVVHESVFDWWYSSSYSGLVTSWQGAPPQGSDANTWEEGAEGWLKYTYTPRGRAFAHYARYVNETWSLPITRTKGTIDFNVTGSSSSPTFNAGAIDPKISAFEDVNGKFISIVMFTPNASTNTSSIATAASSGAITNAYGQGGRNGTDDPTRLSANVGRVEVVLPSGFTATSASALRSYGWQNASGEAWDDVPTGTPRYWINEPVFLYQSNGKWAVEVTLPGGNIISIMVKGTWPGRTVARQERVRPYTVN
jgi:hypothetical protein